MEDSAQIAVLESQLMYSAYIHGHDKKGAVKFQKLVPKNVTIFTKQATTQCLFVLEV